MIRVGAAYTIMHGEGDGRERVDVVVEVDVPYHPEVFEDLAARAREVLRDSMRDTWPTEVPTPAPPDRK